MVTTMLPGGRRLLPVPRRKSALDAGAIDESTNREPMAKRREANPAFPPRPNSYTGCKSTISNGGTHGGRRSSCRQEHNIQGARQAYYDKISKYHLAPLWEVLKGLVTPEPKTQMVPALWKFPEVEKLMLEAGDVITAEEAERRVLVLENPGDPGKSRITNTLFAGIQLIMPGEIAEAHQHVASAIRFVLKGKGAYTAVEGEKSVMEHGDFIITANWAPHDHGNPGKEPAMWLDVLDMPTINHFQTSFANHFDEKMQNVNHEDGNSFERFATGVLPDGMPAVTNRTPVINYPYAKMKPILERLKKTGDVDKRHGARVRYANPINGGPVLPTMGA